MKINGLDDQSLLLIFDRLSVENLLRAGRVCSRWNTIRGKAALSRKSLTLLIGPKALNRLKKSNIRKIPNSKLLTNNEHNVTQIPSRDVNEIMNNTQSQLQINSMFSSFHVNLLSQLFANVQHFTISFPDMNENATLNIPLVNDLLVQWSAKLVTLKLYIYSQRIVAKNCILDTEWLEYLPLLSTINSMESLKVLHLDLASPRFESSGEFEKDNVILMFAFVKRLTQFHFYLNHNLNFSKYLIDCLNMHGDGLCDIATPVWFDNQCLRVKPELAHRFSQFSTKIENAITLRYLCHYFMNLTILNLELEDSEDVDSSINPNTFYRSMSSLKQLIYLSIYCADSFLLKLLVDPTDIQTLYGQDHINTSVQVLQLGVNDDNDELENHAMFERLCLYHFFPQTRVFIFDNHSLGKCNDCQYDRLSYKQYCLKRMLAATGMQHHCEVIKTNSPNIKWSKEELICDDEADFVYSELESDDDVEEDEDDDASDDENENEIDDEQEINEEVFE